MVFFGSLSDMHSKHSVDWKDFMELGILASNFVLSQS